MILSPARRSALLASALAALLAGVVLAQSAAVVDPASMLHTAAPGDTVEGVVRLTNPTTAPMALRVYLSDWDFDPIGQFTFAEVGSVARSASPWVSFAPNVLTIEPQRSAEVRYTVTVPPDTEPGTHWGVLFVESEPTDPEPGDLTATFSVRVGHVVYVNVPPLAVEGHIMGLFGEAPPTYGDPYRLIVQYANTGNVGQGVEGDLSVRDSTGAAVIEARLDRQVVLPHQSRMIQIDLHGPLPAGNYTALVVLDYGDVDVEVAGAHDFTLPDGLGAPGAR